MSNPKPRRLEPLRLPGTRVSDPPVNRSPPTDPSTEAAPPTELMPPMWDPAAAHGHSRGPHPNTEFGATPAALPSPPFVPAAPKRVRPRSRLGVVAVVLGGFLLLSGAGLAILWALAGSDTPAREPAAGEQRRDPVTTTTAPPTSTTPAVPTAELDTTRLTGVVQPRGQLWHASIRGEVGHLVTVVVTGDGLNDLDCWVKGPTTRVAEDLGKSRDCSMQFFPPVTGSYDLTVGNWGSSAASFNVTLTGTL
jgi:hypothetical protein